MLEAKPLVVDFTLESEALQVVSRLPLLSSSHKLGWGHGIHIEYYRHHAWETPEYCQTHHAIVIHHLEHTTEHTTKTERWLDARMQDEQLSTGDITIIPANVPHKVIWDRESDFSLIFLEPAYQAHIAHESVDTHNVEIVPHFAMPDPLIYQIGLSLKSELASTRLGDRFYIDSLTTALAAHLLRNYAVRKHLRPYTSGLHTHKLQQALTYINDCLDQDLSLEAIANAVGISQYHFARMFKQSMGMTPHQYVIQQRVAWAKQLLHRPLSIADIALQCGFANQSHLNLRFKQLVGVTPQNFRKK